MERTDNPVWDAARYFDSLVPIENKVKCDQCGEMVKRYHILNEMSVCNDCYQAMYADVASSINEIAKFYEIPLIELLEVVSDYYYGKLKEFDS